MRHIRNAHTHAAGLVRGTLVDYFNGSHPGTTCLWETVTSEPFRVRLLATQPRSEVNGLVGSLAIQKRLAYDVNVALQNVVSRAPGGRTSQPRSTSSESGKSLKDPTAVRSLRGYARPSFGALGFSDVELAEANRTEEVKVGCSSIELQRLYGTAGNRTRVSRLCARSGPEPDADLHLTRSGQA